jgi:hypothetical protein
MCKVYVPGFERSLQVAQQFEVGAFTVLFGKNNAGKTNLLEDIYLMLATQPPRDGEARIRRVSSDRGRPYLLRREQLVGQPVGAVYVELEPGLEFDNTVLQSIPEHWEPVEADTLRFGQLPFRQVCYASTDREQPELWFTEVREFYEQAAEGFTVVGFREEVGEEDFIYEIEEQQRSQEGPFPRPLFLGWEFHEIDKWVTSAVAKLTALPQIWGRRTGWIEPIEEDQPVRTWRVRHEVGFRLEQLASLASDLLPDFLDGSIRASFHVPTEWQALPEVQLSYHERPNDQGRALEHFGRGASRWMGIAVQIALWIMEGDTQTVALDATSGRIFSGRVLFVDEPEAHLHHSAVASVVRWCNRMVGCGFNVMAASHHEAFLRASCDDVTFVKVSRGFLEDRDFQGFSPRLSTSARTIPMTATSTLQDLADEVGMHPAAALSLHRAILFVEGPLDEAVLDEYAGPALDAAGVAIIPIHGTKNLEGLIDGEFTTRLGIKTGVLTDNTNAATIWDRSNRKRSGEEIKLVRLLKRYEDQGIPPPTPFGVPEDDLLFALPEEAIRDFLKGPFPGWHLLVKECRAAEGSSGSDSVDWKLYAQKQYRLPITTGDGVRRIIRALDLAGVELPSLRGVVREIIDWANQPDSA